jgi:hypothetical protein
MRANKDNLQAIREHVTKLPPQMLKDYPELTPPTELAVNSAVLVITSLLDTYNNIDAWADYNNDVGITVTVAPRHVLHISTYGEMDDNSVCCVVATDGTNIKGRAYDNINQAITDLKTKPFTWWLQYET